MAADEPSLMDQMGMYTGGCGFRRTFERDLAALPLIFGHPASVDSKGTAILRSTERRAFQRNELIGVETAFRYFAGLRNAQGSVTFAILSAESGELMDTTSEEVTERDHRTVRMLPLRDLKPGRYLVWILALDRLRGQSDAVEAKFTLQE